MKKVKNNKTSEDLLKDILIKFYATQLTSCQDRKIIKELAKESSINEQDQEIEVYSKYKKVLENLSNIGLQYLISACSLIENSENESKLKALINFCNTFKIKVE